MDERFNQVKVPFSTFNQVKVSKFGKGACGAINC